ncbi:hypothetical protein HDU99_002620 [Rhizoclosmatium hyalinum]|nr:hypothetical protein HDU99_002620 [Rhizoclosmatium hyalinum]
MNGQPPEYREVCDPNTGTTFYLNLGTGQFQWDRPLDGIVHTKGQDGLDDEWWELYDENRNLPYYYNTGTGTTEWRRPLDGIIIPNTAVGQQMSSAVKRMSTMSAAMVYDSSEDSDSAAASVSRESPRMGPTPNPSPLHLQQASFASLNNQTLRRNPSSSNSRKFEQLGMVPGGSSDAARAISDGGRPSSPTSPSSSLPPSILMLRDTSSDSRVQPISPITPRTRIPRRPQEQVYNPNLATLPKVKPEVLMPDDLVAHMSKFKIDGFAKDHFAQHARGLIFRQKVSLEEILKFQKEPLRSPLMDNVPTHLHKEAIKSFKLILRIMSDVSPGPPYAGSIREVHALLSIGVSEKHLRDEIYVQVCKQVRCNPLAESTFRGWLLLCTMAIVFPPSKDFEEYMKTFTLEHYDGVPTNSWGATQPPAWSQNPNSRENEAISHLAKFCNKKLLRICRIGARGKTPMIQELERAQEAPFRASLFGETLDDIMAVQARENPMDSAGRKLALPRILLFLTDAILSLNGSQTEGIFRVPGDIDMVNDLRIRLERGKYDLKGITDPHVPSSLLKLWLRELAEPLIPANLYDDCIDIGREAMVLESQENVGALAYELLEEMPEINHRVALFMLKFLKVIADKSNQTHTRMTHANIALVFAPNFLRCPSDDPMVIFENTKWEQSFIRVLLTHDEP